METIRFGRNIVAVSLCGAALLIPAAPAAAMCNPHLPDEAFRRCIRGDSGSGSGFDLGQWTAAHPLLALIATVAILAAAVVLIATVIGALTGDRKPRTAPASTPAEAAESSASAAAVVVTLAALAVLLTWWLVSFSWAFLLALIAVPVALIALRIRKGELLEARGHRIAAERHAADVAAARAAYDAEQAARPNPVAGLDGIAPAAPDPFVPPRAPRLTAAQARDLAATGGWTAPAGSALAAVCDRAGRPTPAVAAVDSVARQLKWGAWETDPQGAKMWTPYVSVTRVSGVAGGDARLTLDVRHASVDEGTLTKAMPSLCRALRVRSGHVEMDHRSGQLVLTVTTRRGAEAGTVDAPAEPESEW